MNTARWKNYGLWISIASFVPLVLQGIGLDILPSNYTEIINALLGILVMAGIISNPTTSAKWFHDDRDNPKIEEPKEDILEEPKVD